MLENIRTSTCYTLYIVLVTNSFTCEISCLDPVVLCCTSTDTRWGKGNLSLARERFRAKRSLALGCTRRKVCSWEERAYCDTTELAKPMREASSHRQPRVTMGTISIGWSDADAEAEEGAGLFVLTAEEEAEEEVAPKGAWCCSYTHEVGELAQYSTQQ